LPATIPRIQLDLSGLHYANATSATKVGLTEEKASSTRKAVIGTTKVLMSIAIAIAFLVVIVLLIRLRENDKKKAKEKDDMRFIESVQQYAKGCCQILERALNLETEKNLEAASKELISTTLKKIVELVKDLEAKNEHAAKLRLAINGHEAVIAKSLAGLGDLLNGGSYDFAASYKTLIEESEKQLDSLKSTSVDLHGITAQRKDGLEKLVCALGDLCDRADHTLRFANTQVDLATCQDAIIAAMAGIKSSFDEESLDIIDPAAVQSMIRERGKARSAGVTASDIDELKEFVASRQK
jgi:hypothetical protein